MDVLIFVQTQYLLYFNDKIHIIDQKYELPNIAILQNFILSEVFLKAVSIG